ncbi:MAG: MerC domain-containing protein [Gammaproteobacteria bacterium]|nr:MerC domain-containing protein [Gammaproteobacteria bacterium]
MDNPTMKMDKAAIGLSLLCVVHCLLTPIAIVMFPALGAAFLEDERFHYALLFLVLPTSLVSLGLGCRKHGHLEILAIGFSGLLVLLLTVILGDELLGESGEKISTIVGALIIAVAHIRNFRACQNKRCNGPEQS